MSLKFFYDLFFKKNVLGHENFIIHIYFVMFCQKKIGFGRIQTVETPA